MIGSFDGARAVQRLRKTRRATTASASAFIACLLIILPPDNARQKQGSPDPNRRSASRARGVASAKPLMGKTTLSDCGYFRNAREARATSSLSFHGFAG